jgi:hypothetical protein
VYVPLCWLLPSSALLSYHHGKNGEAALWVYLSVQELQEETVGVIALLVFIFLMLLL